MKYPWQATESPASPASQNVEKAEMNKKRENGGCLRAIAIGVISHLVTSIVLLVLLFVILGIVAKGVATPSAGVDEKPALKTVWSYGSGDTLAVRIPVRGLLIEDDGPMPWTGPGPVGGVLRRIRAATVDPEIKAIILEIDTPGGGITACDMIHKALLDFKATDEDRRIVALFGDVAASGGYYVATAADHILAHPTTLTGSIGVIISKINIKSLGDRYGVRMETIKSGANKSILSPFEDMTEEQRRLLQEVVNEMHGRFVSLVVAGRPNLSEGEVRQIADGRVFTGPRAVRYKLVDEIGYWSDAVAKTCELLGVEELRILRYDEVFSLSAILSAAGGRSITPRSVLDAARARAMFVWQAW